MVSDDAKAMLAYDAEKKSAGVAYILWIILGLLGAHRFYLRRKWTGLAMIVLFLATLPITVVIGAGIIPNVIWAIVDLFLIPGMVRRYNSALVGKISDASAKTQIVAAG